jgi:tetratricopeptide (TPR) repeat protein
MSISNSPNQKTKTRARPSRKRSSTGTSSSLNPEQLEPLLQALCAFSDDADVVAMASEFAGLAAQYREHGAESCQDELSNAVALLSASLSTPNLPTLIIYDIHSQIGLIRESQTGPSPAIQAYLKAFWIASATEDIPQQQLALTLHRLGRAYYLSGNFEQGKSLLARAIQIYEEYNLHREPCMTEAKEMIEECEQTIKDSKRSMIWSSMRGGFGRLSLIKEEQETSERRSSH